MNSEKILILDYSTDRSETPAIKRWLPENSQIVSYFIDSEKSFPDDLAGQNFSHVIHTGSALSITKPAPFTQKAGRYITHCLANGIAQMGICYGHQLICKTLIGDHAVRSSPQGLEAGWKKVRFTQAGTESFGVKEFESVWQHHFDEVTVLPEGSEVLASNEHSQIQAFIDRNRRLFGTQFHPEFDRDAGNEIYFKDEALLKKNGYDYKKLIMGAPTFETGKVIFGYFASI